MIELPHHTSRHNIVAQGNFGNHFSISLIFWLCWITDHRAIKLKKKIDFTRNATNISSFFEILKEAFN